MKRVERFDCLNKADKTALAGLPRTHYWCMKAVGRARPGKTKADKLNGSWKPKSERIARKVARQQALWDSNTHRRR
jgi:hypothetical protein